MLLRCALTGQNTQEVRRKIMEILSKFASFIFISIVIQFAIATVLILFGKGKKPCVDEGSLDFSELLLDYGNLPQLQFFTARDGEELGYRHYPSQSEKVLILIHGSGYHSQYLLPLEYF